MKRIFIFFSLALTLHHSAFAQCNSGSHTVTGNEMITGSCVITGDLTIGNGATLNVDLTGAAADTFIVRGNILLQGDAILWVHASPGATGDQFIVSNSSSNQRSITTKDSSSIRLENIEFRTQEGDLTNASSIYMNYYAEGTSVFFVNKSWLDPTKAWLLCNLNNKSTFLGYEPNELPTEIYLQDTAQMALHGPGTKTGVWLKFESITDTLILPLDQTQPYSWVIGRTLGGLNTQWYFEVDTAIPGLGVQIFPSAQMVINGNGAAAKEVTMAMMFANGTDTLKNLTVGLQNTTVADGPNGYVKLNNVNLGPIAWQIYALMTENLYIKNSVVNEIGIAGPSQVTVDSSLLQLAVLAAVGQGGSTMIVNNSKIWSQAITAANSSTMTLNNCNITGSAFSTSDAGSHITVNAGCFFSNPAGCTMNTALNMTTGQPNCNPFVSAGFPQNLTPAGVTFNGVNSNCTNSLADVSGNSGRMLISPNPFNSTTCIGFDEALKNGKLDLYNVLGQNVKTIENISGLAFTLNRDDLAGGMYFVQVTQDGKTMATGKVLVSE